MARRALVAALRQVGGDLDEDTGKFVVPKAFMVQGLTDAFGVFSVNVRNGEAAYHLQPLTISQHDHDDPTFARDVERARQMVRSGKFYAIVLACVGVGGDAFTQLCVFERPRE